MDDVSKVWLEQDDSFNSRMADLDSVEVDSSVEALWNEVVDKKRVDVKALTTASPVTLKEFEQLSSKNLKDLEKLVLDLTRKEMSKKDVISELKALDNSFV